MADQIYATSVNDGTVSVERVAWHSTTAALLTSEKTVLVDTMTLANRELTRVDGSPVQGGRSIGFSPTGSMVAVGSGNLALVWTAQTQTLLQAFVPQGMVNVRATCFDDAGNVLFISGEEADQIQEAMVVSAPLFANENMTNYKDYSNPEMHNVNFMELASDELVTASYDGYVRVWPLPLNQPRLRIRHEPDLESAAVRVRGCCYLGADVLVSAGEDGKVRLWAAADGTLVATVADHTDIALGVRSYDGSKLATWGVDGLVIVYEWDALLQQCTETFRINIADQTPAVPRADFARSIAFGPDGSQLLVGTNNGFAFVVDVV